MIDINLIREEKEKVKKNIKNKFQNDKLPLIDEIYHLDEKWRVLKAKSDNLRAERNTISKQISEAKKAGKDAKDLFKKAKSIPEEIAKVEKEADELKEKINEKMLQIPNIMHKSVPIGKDASQNKEIKKIGKPKKFNFEIKNHVELAEKQNLADFDASAKVAGNGFYYLIGDLALLNQALIRFAIDKIIKKGFTYMETPYMIHKNVIDGVMSFKEMQDMIYKIENEDLYLIGTAEHSLIGYFKEKMMNWKDLPKKISSYSMCFRKEVGSHSINEKGLYRTHQFNKVEMVVLCHPKDSYKFYNEMLKIAIEIYKELGIPTRVLEICSGDLSDLKAKSCDLEFWSPVENKYVEIGSLTNMEEAQARRLGIKFVDKDNEKKFVHILNNTVLASSRAMRAILENNQQKDGTIKVPKVLQKYLGKKVIGLPAKVKKEKKAKKKK